MSDVDCVAFLQWALPRLDMRWAGFRKVRGQVCKRIKRRMRQLGLDEFSAYRERLEAEPQEWLILDGLCHITISRFFRDRGVFETVRRLLLAEIAGNAERHGREARCWSAGCASGEEPYTVKILWDLDIARSFPGVPLSIVATDVDEFMLERARQGCFEPGSLHELPPHFVTRAFDRIGDRFCIRSRHREGVRFLLQDLRSELPSGLFDLVLCRNVAFTYFALPLQKQVCRHILERLRPGGYFAIGTHEHLPEDLPQLMPIDGPQQIFQFSGNAQTRLG
jgi:chemotaxis protein methyltransferase CheR